MRKAFIFMLFSVALTSAILGEAQAAQRMVLAELFANNS